MDKKGKKTRSLTWFAGLSIAAAIFTISLKFAAYLLTDSVGLFSDAMESMINLAGAMMAFAMLKIAARPADESHAYGHSKAEYFSSGFEGLLIFIAAILIGISSVERLINPRNIEQVGTGLVISVIASLINFFVSITLKKAGRRYNSITLEADARHLMTDVWTSGGVLLGIGGVAITGWLRLDPIIALLMAANIIWSGISIFRKSISGLMDRALSAEDQARIKDILESHATENVEFHALRTRQSAARPFVSFHVLVPGSWSVLEGHELIENIEADLRKAFPGIILLSHLEPLEDPSSYEDISLEREDL